MAELIIGTKLTAATGQWHGVAATGGVNTQGLVLLAAPEPLFLNALGGFMRRSGGNNSRVQIAAWADDAGQPGALLGYTGTILVGSAAAVREAPLAWSKRGADLGIAGAAIALEAGQKIWLGVQVEAAGVDIARAAAVATALVYRRQSSGNPPDPFDLGATPTTATVALPALWGVTETNGPPVLTLTGPAATVATAQPVIAGSITDPQSVAPSHDRLRSYALELRQQGQTALIWAPDFTAAAAERAAAAFSRTYDGPVLTEGAYEVRAQATDDAGVPSNWTGWRQFVIANLGSIDVSSAAPTGKLEHGVPTVNWTARWTHPLGLNADRAWVRVLSGVSVVRETATTTPGGVVVNVASNAFVALTNAQAAVALSTNPLPPGVYTWQMQARATDGSLSPWSPAVPLNVNFPPNQPSSLRPVSGTTHAARPLTDWLLSDPDLDDVLGVGLLSIWELTHPDGVTKVTKEVSSVDPVTGRGYYQPLAADMPVNTTTVPYQLRVRGRDASAIGTPSEFGPWSPPTALYLVTAPIVAITAPAENAVVATSTLQLTWTITDGQQVQFRVQLYRAGQPEPFFSSGQIPVAIPASSGAYSVPAGWLKPGNLYDADVTIWTAGGVSSTSPKRRFSVQYADANLVPDVAAALVQHPRDLEPVTVVVTWGPTSYPVSQFGGYVVWRRPTTDDPDEAVPIALVRAPGQLSWADHHAPPNEPLIYAVTQLRRSGSDVQSSQPVEVEIEVPLTVPVIASLESGAGRRFPLLWLNRGLSGGFEREEAAAPTWGSGGKKTLVRSPAGHGARTFSVDFNLKSTHGATVQERLADVRAVVESGDPVSLRTQTEAAFCRVVPSNRYWRRGSVAGTVDVTLQLEEIAWSQAVSLTG